MGITVEQTVFDKQNTLNLIRMTISLHKPLSITEKNSQKTHYMPWHHRQGSVVSCRKHLYRGTGITDESDQSLTSFPAYRSIYYLAYFNPQAVAVAVFFPCCPYARPFLWLNITLAWFLVWRLMWTFPHRHHTLSTRATSCWRRRGSRARWRIFTNFVTNLFRHIT